ncbi:MAG: hypothetical protein AAFX07_06120 [Pseudomonadota bacterium]
MDPEKKKALDKLVHRERLIRLGVPLAVLLLLIAGTAFLNMPREQLGDVETRLQRFLILPDEEDGGRMIVTLPDGGTIRIKMLPGDSALAPGAPVCLAKTRHPVMRTVSYTRIPQSRCG